MCGMATSSPGDGADWPPETGQSPLASYGHASPAVVTDGVKRVLDGGVTLGALAQEPLLAQRLVLGRELLVRLHAERHLAARLRQVRHLHARLVRRLHLAQRRAALPPDEVAHQLAGCDIAAAAEFVGPGLPGALERHAVERVHRPFGQAILPVVLR